MPFGSAVPDAIRGLLGTEPELPGLPDAPPSWKDRLKEAAYTSPSGVRVRFTYENVSRSTTKRTVAFEFPGVNDAYVQGNGFGARRYPLRCFFWGDNHDRIASAFEAALLEPGRGRLEHPLYGTFDVVPFGDIDRRDDLKDAANETVVDVTFWTSTGAVYPSSLISARSEILATLDGFNVAAANQFSNATDVTTALAKANLKTKINQLLTKVSGTLSDVAAVNTAVLQDFRDIQSAINFGLDVLVGQPLQLAQQMANMITAPARALDGIRSRLDAYARLAESITVSPESSGTGDGTTLARARTQALNAFAADDLVALTAVSGSVLSILETVFETKPQALAAAEAVLAQLNAVVTWRDTRFGGLRLVDPGGAYQALQQAVALAAGFLIQASETLLIERRVVLDRQRTIIDLAAELYGSVDDRLDFLISTNELSGEEILELQPGRVIKYYV